MNRDQKAAVIDRVAGDIEAADAVFAVDYRGLSVKQASDLRTALREADTSFTIVKNTLTERAADQAGAEHLKPFLVGPTAFAFVRGDVALAAKALARFRRESGLLEWKGGQMDGNPLTPEELDALSKLPSREQLHAQLVGTIASPLTTLVRGLAGLISGLASQLQQVADQGLVGGDSPSDSPQPAADSPQEEAPAAEEEAPAAEEAPAEEAPADEAKAEEPQAAAEDDTTSDDAPAEAEADPPAADSGQPAESDAEAPGDPVAEAEAADEKSETENEEG